MPKTVAAFLGIDVGTTTVKAVLVGVDGRIIAEAETEQQVSTPHPGWAEQDPSVWWRGTETSVTTVMHKAEASRGDLELRAIGLSGQMHSSVFLDAGRKVIRPALLWNDVRTTEQCQEITGLVGLGGLRRMVGNPALEGFTAPKVLWLRQNEPANFARLKSLLLAKDYVRYRLTGELATDPSDAAGTLLFDVRSRRWSLELLSALDVSPEMLPPVVGSSEVSGRVTARVARDLDVPARVPVVAGGADNAAGAVGSGVVSEGRVQSSIGTSGTLLTPVDRTRIDRRMRLHTFCHCVPDQWYLMGVVLSAGASLSWLRDVLSPGDANYSYNVMTGEAESVTPGSDGLLFLPYLTGERTPHSDSSARGVFFGLHLGHGRAHLVRAVMEGVCFALRDSMELMRGLAVSVSEVRAIGGGARSRLWRRLQADVYGVPVTTVGPASGPAYGAAVLAAVGAGEFASISEATGAWLRVEETVEPDPRRMRMYGELYEAYRQLYPALKARFAETAALNERLSR